MKIVIFLFLFFLNGSLLFSQNKQPIYKQITPDCNKAIVLNINKSLVYGPTIPPDGYGEIQEIKKTNSKFSFEEEHNTSWYLLTIYGSGNLCFDITPQDTTNDYDFILFPYFDSTTCSKIATNQVKPLRSNLSRNDFKNKSKTGLLSSSKTEFVTQGIGSAYSKPIEVNKGEKYLLILDNVYPNGKGHTLNFYIMKTVEINGMVTDSANKPIIADISLSDTKGNIVEQTQSNTLGIYKIKTSLIENQNYALTIMGSNTFIDTKIINTKQLKSDPVFNNLQTILPKLKGGRKYILGNINFYGNTADLLPESYSSVEALYKLMKKNKNMTIQIEGHVNNPEGKEKEEDMIILSEKRAKNVFSYLIRKGINEKRLSTLGLGSVGMLYPHPKNAVEEIANRRVEIKVISIYGE